MAALAAVFLPHHDLDRQPHERAHIGRDAAVGAGDEDDIARGDKTGDDIFDSRIGGAQKRIQFLQHGDFLRRRRIGERIARRITGLRGRRRRQADGRRFALPQFGGAGDGSELRHRAAADFVAVRVGDGLAAQGPQADAAIERITTGFDFALFQPPRFHLAPLRVNIGPIDAAARARQLGAQNRRVDIGRRQQNPARGLQRVFRFGFGLDSLFGSF